VFAVSQVDPAPDTPMPLSWFSLLSPSTFRSTSHFACVPPPQSTLPLDASHCIADSRRGGVTPLVLHIDTGTSEWSASLPSRFAPWGQHPWHPFGCEDRWAPEPVCMFSIEETSVGRTGDGSPNRPALRLVTVPTELSRIPSVSRKK